MNASSGAGAPVVIAGAGLAASQAARSLRAGGYAGGIVIIGSETLPPYNRPPLSKAFLSGDMEAERLLVVPPAFYETGNIKLRLGETVTGIDRAAKRAILASGEPLAFSKLILATGSSPRRLTVAAHPAANVFYLRGVDDAKAIRGALTSGSRAVIIGAGYIGLEVAASARKRGCEVTVIELADRAMARVASPPISALFGKQHREAGVDFRFGASAKAINKDSVTLQDGSTAAADAVIIGIGVTANDALARAAGLDCDDGVLVDAQCRTSDADIFAIGDAAKPFVESEGRRIRFEAVATALTQAKAAASAILGLPPLPGEAPWFWSDQYDLKLQIAGLWHAGDAWIERRRKDGTGMAVLHARAGRLVAVEAVNDAASFVAVRKLLAGPPRRIDLVKAADSEMPLAQALQPD